MTDIQKKLNFPAKKSRPPARQPDAVKQHLERFHRQLFLAFIEPTNLTNAVRELLRIAARALVGGGSGQGVVSTPGIFLALTGLVTGYGHFGNSCL